MNCKMTRVERPDLIEYHTESLKGTLEIFYDDYHGQENEGWVVRLINKDEYGRVSERDVPMKGRKDSKPTTLRRNALEALA